LVDERAEEERPSGPEAAAIEEGDFVDRTGTLGALAVCAVALSAGFTAPVVAADPPYVLLLRSREAAVTPERTKDAQTGGGFIQVTQIQPNIVMALMRGTVAAGTSHKEGSAAMQFNLHQDFEVVATRAGLRPPRLVLAGWVIGAVESTLRGGGMAEHSPACANVQSGGESLMNLCLNPHGAGGGENLLVNDRVGPVEAVLTPGSYCLNQSFTIRAVERKAHCHTGGAAAAFDPDPKLDSRWNEVLKPFRAVPHKDFGFRVILRVVEDVPPPQAAPPTEPLPLPREQKIGQPILDKEKVGSANPIDGRQPLQAAELPASHRKWSSRSSMQNAE
jgi:hypothetical protein